MCDFSIQEPTEVYVCELKFGSWVYNAAQLDLENVPFLIFFLFNVNLFQPLAVMDLEGFVGHAVWELDSTNVMRHETLYDCCPAPFVDITYDIKIRKKQGSGWKFGK